MQNFIRQRRHATPNLDLKRDLKVSIFSSPNAKFSLSKWRANSKNHNIGLFINLDLKKPPHEAFLAHQMRNFLRQVDVQPPPKSLSILIL